MMATYYVKPGDPGSNSGTLANPWTSLQTAMNTVAAGDTVYCQGTQTLSAIITTPTNGASNSAISVVGTNASWVEDGTYFVLNGNNAVTYCLVFSKTYLIFRNIEFKLASTGGASYTAGANYDDFINCYFHNCGTYGLITSTNYVIAYKCTASNCPNGFYDLYQIINCMAYSCGTGVAIPVYSVLGCIVYDNSSYGINTSTYSTLISNTVVNNSVVGISISVNNIACVGNRITNNATAGIQVNTTYLLFEDFNFFLGNGINIQLIGTAGVYSPGNSLSAGTEGYVNKSGKVFNLADAATLRCTPTQVGGGVPTASSNWFNWSAGLVPREKIAISSASITGTTLTITGWSFKPYSGQANATVTINGSGASLTSCTDTSIVVDVTGKTGYLTLVVTNADGDTVSATVMVKTTLVPTGLALAVNGNVDGELIATISNSGSYAATDMLMSYNNSGDTLMGCCMISDYIARGGLYLTGLTANTTYTIYAKSSSDGNTYSAKSSTASATTKVVPTYPATNKVITDTNYGPNGTDYVGIYTAPSNYLDHVVRTSNQIDFYGSGFGASQGAGMLTGDVSSWTITLWTDSHVTAVKP